MSRGLQLPPPQKKKVKKLNFFTNYGVEKMLSNMMIDEAARNTDEIRKFIDYRMIERGGEEKGDLEE